MKIFQSITFAKQLIIYLLTVLIITFIFISLTLTNSVQQFIGNNAYSQAQTFADNLQNTFRKEILKIEHIPEKITDCNSIASLECVSTLPIMLLKTYNQLIECSIHYTTVNSVTNNNPHIIAQRQEDGNITLLKSEEKCSFRPPITKQILCQSPQGGTWIYSRVRKTKTIAFCYPLCDSQNRRQGYLKLDFPLKAITDIICDHKLYKYGNLFIIDSTGNYLAGPLENPDEKELPYLFQTDTANYVLAQRITKGETGSSTYYDHDTKYFVYYAPLSCMRWRIGIICPYNETLKSSHKLYWVIFLCLGGSLLFLFIGIINIVHRLSSPLKELAYNARQIADGQFNVEIPQQKSSNEINELYNSFRYMQHSIVNYIEKLKISTAEKEQRNSEMVLARRIQQRFLHNHIEVPKNIELAAELRQSLEVGGDLYEFFLLSNRLYFAIGDVSGKGTPAALYMVSICKLFRYVANTNTSTATICNIINKHMCEDAEDDMYVTMFMGILDINTGIITFTNAGHPYPLVIHENGETNFLREYPDVPIGVLEDHCFTEHTYTLHKNTSILFYTDGITDAENPAGKFYGKENLVKCVQKVAAEAPQIIIETILKDIKKHIDARNQSDDLTLLLLRFKGIP